MKLPMTKNMRKDLEFYLKHNEEMYFSGMVVIASGFVILVGVGIIELLRTNESGWAAFAAVNAVGFACVKMYLHIRKDLIEIKEQYNSITR